MEDMKLLTTEQLAAKMKINRVTLQRWRQASYGPPYLKIGTKYYYREDAVRQWVLDQETKATRKIYGRS